MNTPTYTAEHGPPHPPIAAKPKKRRWAKVLLGIVILLCGIIIGAGGTAAGMHKLIHRVFEHPEELPEMITTRMEKKLNLTREQAVEVKGILDTRIGNIQEIMREVHPRIHGELMLLRDEIDEVLDEEQGKKWRERFKRFHEFMPAPKPASGDEN
jgi:hypothetical protein